LHFIYLFNKYRYWIFLTWFILSVFSLQNAVFFHNSNLFVSCIIHILYTGCAKIKKNNSGAKRLNNEIKKQVTSSWSIFIQAWQYYNISPKTSTSVPRSTYSPIQAVPEVVPRVNLLKPELFFLILAHPVYKIWIIQEPNTLELWNKLHFEEEKNGGYISCLKYSVPIFVE